MGKWFVIWLLAGGDWSFYDTQFRCLRQLRANEMPWGSTHWELWIKAQNFGNSKPKIPQGKPPRFASWGIPKGFCHKFHNGVECHGCKYKHTCYKCNLFRLQFNDFKHSYNRPSVRITLSRRSDLCPVQSLVDYISHRGLSEGPLFCTVDGRPVQRKLFSEILSTVLNHCGLDPTKYKGHSFRIGAATFAAESGFSDAQIRAMGRWKSDAFRKYIRTPSLTTAA